MGTDPSDCTKTENWPMDFNNMSLIHVSNKRCLGNKKNPKADCNGLKKNNEEKIKSLSRDNCLYE